MEKNSNIGLCAIYTILILLSISIISSCFCILISPVRSGEFCYNLGWNGFSSSLYIRQYKKDGDINTIMQGLNIAIEGDNIINIIKSYELAKTNHSFGNYISLKNQTNYNNNKINILAKSNLVNESNYYANKYIYALKEVDLQKAYDISVSNLQETYKSSFDYMALGDYTISTLLENIGINNVNLLEFNIELNTSVYDYLIDYYDLLCTKFQKLSNQELDNVHFLNLCNRILIIGNDIVQIDECLDQNVISEVKINDIVNYADDINDKILEVLNK